MEPWFRRGLAPLYDAPALFASRDPQEAKVATTGALKEHDLVWRSGKVDSFLRHLQLGEVSLFLLRYGAAVHIAPGELRRFLLIQVPLTGAACITVGRTAVAADSRTGVVISPTLPLVLDWNEGCEQLLLKIPRERVEESCSRLLGAQIGRAVEFSPRFALDTAQGQSWQHQVSSLLCGFQAAGSPPPAQWVRAQEEILIQHLLLCHPHNYTELLRRRSTGARRNVRLAQEFIHAHLQDALDLGSIAQASGTSVRSLCAAFKEQYGQSPMAYVREQRMEQAHAELLGAAPGTRVTDVALRWGFGHLGRFCTRYRQRYGQTPLETLQD
ncbi:MAG TPA: AraC family transcriptional regulator [Pusillimonas sp.]|uniref:AraC family transcriptional regulator n=1 Tax=Pusillimonas sp. TaxID=3040095 RepID=UPI002C824C58|nr:AraC family transcriptional regulator [Pusillimonas sp.]HUH87418.1 AraC family transcriptional regulator [Pusillimonas sp.]